MGTFSKSIHLFGPSGASETLEGMIDTGAHFTVVPAQLLQRLGVEPREEIPIQFANGDVTSWQLGEVEAELEGRRRPILVLFGEDDETTLIGAHALEAFLLDVDVVKGELVPKRALLMTT